MTALKFPAASCGESSILKEIIVILIARSWIHISPTAFLDNTLMLC